MELVRAAERSVTVKPGTGEMAEEARRYREVVLRAVPESAAWIDELVADVQALAG